jgi:hypothetical protein
VQSADKDVALQIHPGVHQCRPKKDSSLKALKQSYVRLPKTSDEYAKTCLARKQVISEGPRRIVRDDGFELKTNGARNALWAGSCE